MSGTKCSLSEFDICRDESQALILKFIALTSILLAGVAGIAIPLIGKQRQFLRTDGNLFVTAKAFSAGVILSTGFVHMLSGGSEALSNPCLPKYPWTKFPFSSFFAMAASLLTLLVDTAGTQYYERKHRRNEVNVQVGCADASNPQLSNIVHVSEVKNLSGSKENSFCEEDGGGNGMHIVGVHAHAAHHKPNHPCGQAACHGYKVDNGLHHGHDHRFGDGDVEGGVRHVVVSQILELGIVSHSVIIGLSLGVSQSSCTIRPLIAALSFHQFFEGFALGGCISQAQFKAVAATLMAFFFAITTPAGIGIGAILASFYDADTSGALIVEGILDSLSAGILIYMSLVELIAVDFLSKRMSSNFLLQMVSYFMLFLGAGLMSLLAIWA